MDKRRESLKKLLKALNKDYSIYLTESDKERLEKLEPSFLAEIEDLEKIAEIDPSFAEMLKDEDRIDELTFFAHEGLDEIAEIIASENLGGPEVLEILDEVPSEKCIELRQEYETLGITVQDIPLAGRINPELGRYYMEDNAMVLIGRSFGRLGIKVEVLPSIVLKDTAFIKSYLENFLSEEDSVREGHPDYERYKKCVDFVKRKQAEVDLKDAKEEQNELTGRSQKITETEKLINQQQGQQKE